jgi:hypothetical protein
MWLESDGFVSLQRGEMERLLFRTELAHANLGWAGRGDEGDAHC